MGAIHFYPNSKLQTMFLPRKATHLFSKANRVAHIIQSPTIRCSAASVSRTMASMSKDGIGVDSQDLEPIFEHKRSLRSKVRKALKNMDPIQRSQEDNAIQNTVVESSWFKTSKSVCAYISSPPLLEVDTSRIISEVLSSPAKERKRLYVPRVEDRNSNMKMLMISSVDDLIEKSMNILEPALVDSDGIQREDAIAATYELCRQVIQSTCLYYPNYQQLTKKNRWKQPLLVALSYSVQIIEEGEIPVTPFDIPVDALVSPAGFIPISTAALRRCE